MEENIMSFNTTKPYHIVSCNNTNQYLNVSGIEAISNGKNVDTYALESKASAQRWFVKNSTGNTKILSGLDFKAFSLDYNTGSPVGNCDVWKDESANDTDQIVSISGDNTNGYTIRVVGRDKYLTATGTGDGSNVRWDSLVSSGNTQLWKFNLVPNTTTAGLTDATGTVATNKYTTTEFQQNLDIVNVTSTRTISSVTPSGGVCKIPNISVPFNQYSTKIKNMNSKFGTACKAFACAAIYSYYTQKLISPYWFPIQSNGSYNIQYGNPIGEITKNAYKCFEFLNISTTLSNIKSTLEAGKPILICCSLSGATHWVAAYGYKNNCASKSDILVVDSVNLNAAVEYGTAKYKDEVTDLDLSESMRINLKNGSTYAIQSAWTINIRNN